MTAAIDEFVEVTPTAVNGFRGIVLFGRNVASYKFALAKTLVELAAEGHEAVPLDQLAVPFARHVCEHLQIEPRQATSASSKFLDACRQYNEGELSESALLAATERLGFVNVIDAFHVVGAGELPMRFFIDERRTALKGIRLTPELLGLDSATAEQLTAETEARWRLVETAWSLGISSSLITYEPETGQLAAAGRRRSPITARNVLNGYQKGKCFYCFRSVGTTSKAADLADVDHFFPFSLQRLDLMSNLDQVWNLVLACRACNRGPSGKFEAVPDSGYLVRLFRRNEYLIASHHPLRETLLSQTGSDGSSRRRFLQLVLNLSREVQPRRWRTEPVADPTF